MIPGSANPLLLAGAAEEAAYTISRSLRFNSADSAYLSRTPSSAGNRKTWTWSGWVKCARIDNGGLSNDQVGYLFEACPSGTAEAGIRFFGRQISVWQWNTTDAYQVRTLALLRDPSAWMHILVAVDSTQSTSTDRIKIYFNGVQQTQLQGGAVYPSLNFDGYVNDAIPHNIGRKNNGSRYFNGYLADVHFIDGQALDPTSFGEFDEYNNWQPKAYTHSLAITSSSFSLADNDFTWSGLRTSSANTPSSGVLTDGNLNYSETFWGNNGADGSYLDIDMTGAAAGETFQVRYWNAAEAAGQTITATCKQIDSNGSDISGTASSQTWTQGQKWNTYSQTIAANCDRIRLIFSNNSNNSFGWGIGEVEVTLTPTNVNDFHLDFSDATSTTTIAEDSSGNNNDWTANNITAYNAISLPSVAFDGNGDGLNVATSADFGFGTSDWTIEAWVNPENFSNNSANKVIICDFTGTGRSNHHITSSGYLGMYNGASDITSTGLLTVNRWHHVAWVKTSNVLKMFLNGTQVYSAADTRDYGSSRDIDIGVNQAATGEYFKGVISNLRLVKGTALYTASFTPPTAPLTNVTNTVLLCCQSATSATAATVSPGTITANGDAFATTATDSSADLDSLRDSPTNSGTDTGAGGEVSGNYCTWNPLDLLAITLANGNLQASGSTSTAGVTGTIGVPSGKYYWEVTAGSTYDVIAIWSVNSRVTNFPGGTSDSYGYYGASGQKFNAGTGSTYGASFTSGDVIGVALDLDNGTLTFYKNGVSQGTAFTGITGAFRPAARAGNNTGGSTATYLNAGQRPFAYDISTGISEATGAIPILSTSDDYGQTLSSGTASDSNSSSVVLALPMNGTNGGTTFTDYSATIKGSGSAKTVTSSNATTSTTQSKWYGSSGSFGTAGNNNISVASSTDFAFGTGDFTIEFYIYLVSSGANNCVLDLRGAVNGANYLLRMTSSSAYELRFAGGSVVGFTASASTWNHLAISRSSGTTRIYVNGVQAASVSDSSNASSSGPVYVSSFPDTTGSASSYGFEGYMADLRVYKGVAKYTSNFTPPFSALFKALCTANLDEPTVPDGSTAMDAITYDGNNTTQTITGLNFSPDLVWIKRRPAAENHVLTDTVRGASKALSSDSTAAEKTTNDFGLLTAFTSDGFTVTAGSSNPNWVNASGSSYATWAWDAGSSTVSNTDGSITSSVRANPTAGFSIATFTNVSGTQSVGHGLGVAPHMVIIRYRNIASDWTVYHESLGTGKYINLNSTAAAQSVAIWGSGHTSSVVGLSGFGQNNQPAIMYSFAPVEGYSAVGKWTGGSDAFVYLGFRPKWLLVKANASGYEWLIFDSERSTYNLVDDWLVANTAAAEVTNNATNNLDFLSNGFKIKGTGGYFGVSTDMLYLAFASHPFRVSRAR